MTQKELERMFSRLNDIHEITNLQGRYNHLIVTSNFEAVVDLFAKKDPNVKAEIADSGVYEGAAGIKRLFLRGVESKHRGEEALACRCC